MGTPVIGRRGTDTLVSFQGESILRNANMDMLIAESEADYIKKAIFFASEIRESKITRAEILHSVRNSPLFNLNIFARNLERALHDMWNRKTLKDFSE